MKDIGPSEGYRAAGPHALRGTENSWSYMALDVEGEGVEKGWEGVGRRGMRKGLGVEVVGWGEDTEGGGKEMGGVQEGSSR